MRSRLQLAAACLLTVVVSMGPIAVRGTSEAPEWIGAGGDNNWSTPANWQTGTAPASGASVYFSSMRRYLTTLDTAASVGSLTFDNDHHQIGGSTLTIGSGGLAAYGDTVVFDAPLVLNLSSPQTWYVSWGTLRVDSTIVGSGLTLGGGGTFKLNGTNSLSGTVTLSGSDLHLGNDLALGSAALVIGPGTGTVRTSGGDRVLGNNITASSDSLELDTTGGQLTLNGQITLASGTRSTSLDINGPNAVVLAGSLAESGGSQTLNLTGSGTLIVQGLVGTTGGATVSSGRLVFDASATLSASGSFTVSTSGYLGTGGTSPAAFLAAFNKSASTGSFGFDNGVTITAPIDLTGFASTARLGSSTTATLSATATITPQGTAYNFGGGGGTLRVESDLTGNRGLNVTSPWGQSLTLILAGNNDAGDVTIDNSVVRFESANAFRPAGTFTIGDRGYLGFDYDVNLASLSLWSRVSTGGTFVYGVDSPDPGSPRGVTLTTDSLGYLPSGTILGTSSAATLTISAGETHPNLTFAAVKDGHLTVAALPAGSYAVSIGLWNEDASDSAPGSFSSWKSTVTLLSANAYTGGTSLLGGRLELGDAAALGTGTLSVYSDATLAATSSLAAPIANPVSIPGYNNLSLDSGAANNFTLSGPISGSGSLIKEGTGTVRLTGVVDLTGSECGVADHEVRAGTLELGGLTSTDGVMVVDDDATLKLDSSITATVAGLKTDNDRPSSTAAVNLGAEATLVIDRNDYDTSMFSGTISGTGRILKTGSGVQYLGSLPGPSASTYSGGTVIEQGTLVALSSGALGTGPITLSAESPTTGGLAVYTGATLTNSLTFVSGRLGGLGTFAPANGPITVGYNQRLEPGLELSDLDVPIGTLGFGSGLVLASGGTYVWQISDALGQPGTAWDALAVTGTLSISASPSDPFVVAITSYGEGVYNFDATQPFSWVIASAGSISGFNDAALLADASGFYTSLGDGHFYFSQSGNELLLNFTPVPEPGVSALLGTGLAALLLRRRRRRP